MILVVLLLVVRSKKRGRITPKTTFAKASKPSNPAQCPYCKFIFDKKPKRNRKCPNCQSKIILRNHQLLTEQEANQYDKMKNKQIAKQLDRHRRRSLIEQQKLSCSKYTEISAAGGCCPACGKLDGKKVLIRNELKSPTLPVKNCTSEYGFCRCSYLPVID